MRHIILWATLLLAGDLYAAQRHPDYRPLFSDAVLDQADAERRTRLLALEDRNYQRWLQQNGGRSSPVASSSAKSGAAPTGSGGGLYRYRDAQGTVRYSDKYVEGAQRVAVKTSAPSSASKAEHAARMEEQARMLEYYKERDAQRARGEAQRQQEVTQQAKREENCNKLFLDIQDNRRGGFVSYDLGPNGERVYISDEELAARTDKMEEKYKKHCGKLPNLGR